MLLKNLLNRCHKFKSFDLPGSTSKVVLLLLPLP